MQTAGPAHLNATSSIFAKPTLDPERVVDETRK